MQSSALLRNVLVLLLVLCGAAPVLSENLIANADFGPGTPGEAGFAWQLDLAPGDANACSVEEGRTPASRALRIYNDEIGNSYVTQDVPVEQGQWYLAEAWIQPDGMRALHLGPGLHLGDQTDVLTWKLPKAGWQRLTCAAYSGQQEQLTLRLGGTGWSGDVLYCEPVVRQCTIEEAAATGQRSHPWWMRAPEAKDEGYAFYGRVVCQVARNFPNYFQLMGRAPAPDAPEGRIIVALPPGVKYWPKELVRGSSVGSVTPLPDGGSRVEFDGVAPSEVVMVLDSDLMPREQAVGRIYYEWKGGWQLPFPVVFEGVELPHVQPLKRALVQLSLNGWAQNIWNGNVAKMSRDLRRLGFNALEIWGGSPGEWYDPGGLQCAVMCPTHWKANADHFPEAQAVTLSGERCEDRGGLMCPSYVGPAMQEQLDRVKDYAAQASALSLDDEWYASSGESPQICFCERCLKLWAQWAQENAPDLPDVDPRVFEKQPHKYPDHHHAWLRFRCHLVAQRYALIRKAFLEAVAESGARSTPRPWVQAYIGGGPVFAMHDNRELAEVLDYVCNMVYCGPGTAEGIREWVRYLAPQTGKKLVMALSPGMDDRATDLGPPGDRRARVLEAMMGGSQGVVIWNYFHASTADLIEIAEAVRMIGPVEDVVLDGAFRTDIRSVLGTANLLARRDGDVTVLLVSDYGRDPGENAILVPGHAHANVVDLATGRTVARLTAGDRTFTVTLSRNNTARLFRIAPAS